MLESVFLIISLFLLAYCFRSIVFLYTSKKYLSDLEYTSGKLKGSGLNKHKGEIANHDNVIFYDSVINRHEPVESGKNLDVPEITSHQLTPNCYCPIISIIVATHNEERVIGSLLQSLQNLTYDHSRFEVIVVDDSTDSTVIILEEWKKKMENLKVIRKSQRIGSKGGALNMALDELSDDSTWVMVLDADIIVSPDTIEKFLHVLSDSNQTCTAVQGYSIPYNNHLQEDRKFSNWVSNGVELRLALRNMIEFVARDKLNLPVQITGSLFMARRSTLEEIGFSTDLCEDWDLTLRLYLKESETVNTRPEKINGMTKSIVFTHDLNSWSQCPTAFWSYFNQRVRVSEGHTRGFIKLIPKLIGHNLPFNKKIEIFLTGFHYIKYLFILCILGLDMSIGLAMATANTENLDLLNNSILGIFSIQLFCLVSYLVSNINGMIICNKSNKLCQYNTKFLLSKMLLDTCTLPALIIGSFRGIFWNKGKFYKTQRIACDIQMSGKNLISG